jgi:hypothetical protein
LQPDQPGGANRVGTSLLLKFQLGRLKRQTLAEARALFAAVQVVFLTLIDQAEMGYPLSGIRWLGHDVAFAEAVGAKIASAQATTSTATEESSARWAVARLLRHDCDHELVVGQVAALLQADHGGLDARRDSRGRSGGACGAAGIDQRTV